MLRALSFKNIEECLFLLNEKRKEHRSSPSRACKHEEGLLRHEIRMQYSRVPSCPPKEQNLSTS